MDIISFWLVVINLLLFIAYAILISYYNRGWQQLQEFELKEASSFYTKITVVIPARNEEKNIATCLQSLQRQTYPKELLEIIVVDDHSNDNTAEIVNNFPAENIKLIRLADHVEGELNSYKKKAIEIAIGHSSGEWIVTTDADCRAGCRWIETMMAYQLATEAVFIAAPVKLLPGKRILDIFQTLDFITLQGITAASVKKRFHAMCNGANLGYSKQAFEKVNGFGNIDNLASGDDMLLMQKIQKEFPDNIFYLKSKEAIVSSLPASGWKEFWHQRIRWASKSGQYEDKRIFRSLLLVYVFNLALLALFILSLSLWNTDAILVSILLLLCKTIVEYPFVSNVAAFFGQRQLMLYFAFMQPLHILYIVIAGFLGKFRKYEWKGRRVR